jgi:hypothetical protein
MASEFCVLWNGRFCGLPLVINGSGHLGGRMKRERVVGRHFASRAERRTELVQ